MGMGMHVRHKMIILWRKIARAMGMGMGMHVRHKMIKKMKMHKMHKMQKKCWRKKMHMMGAMGMAPPMMHGAGAMGMAPPPPPMGVALPPPPPMAVDSVKEQVDAIAAMGFPPHLAFAALTMASGSADEAVALLTERRGAVRRFMRHHRLGRGPHGHGPPHGFRGHHGPRGHRHGFPMMAPQLAPPPAVDQQLAVREA